MARLTRSAVLIGSQIALLAVAAPALAQSYPPSVGPGASVAGAGRFAGTIGGAYCGLCWDWREP
jgi:hypothetical protein